MAEKAANPKPTLQSETVPFSVVSRNQLAQFAAAAAKSNKPLAPPKPVETASSTTTTDSSTASASASTATAVSSKASEAAPPSTPTATKPDTPSATAASGSSESKASSSSTQPSDSTAHAQTYHGHASNASDVKIELKPPMPKPIDLQNFKGTKFVSLDPLVIEHGCISETASGTYQWEECAGETDRCIAFLKNDGVGKRCFLVCSGGQGLVVVPQIHDLEQVYGIYIFCSDVKGHQQWSSKYDKVRMVCSDERRHLQPQLAIDAAQTNLEWGLALLQKGDKATAKKKLEAALKRVETIERDLFPDLKKQIQRKLDEAN